MDNECIMSNEFVKALEEFIRKIAKEEIISELAKSNLATVTNITISQKDINVKELLEKINTVRLGKFSERNILWI